MLQLCVFCFYFYSINYNNQGFNLMDHYNSQYRNFNSDKKTLRKDALLHTFFLQRTTTFTLYIFWKLKSENDIRVQCSIVYNIAVYK